ncbi:MAG: hypothetical protein JOZ68_15430 [Acidimicrobiia bacterium]|nr:hypothetical protein [Acidimicrobiia bacterium]
MKVQASPVRRSTFATVIVIVLVVLAALGVVIHLANAGHHRPEGAAERWLAAVGDTGRKGVTKDARTRAEKIGPVAVATPLLPPTHDRKKSEFADLEVGKAVQMPTSAAPVANTRQFVRVPFRLHQELASGVGPLKTGTLVMERVGDSWHVTALDARRPGEKVRSEGGPPPSRAPLALWFGAVALGLLLATGAHLITRYAEKSAKRAMGQPAAT